jgi:hypothetical protein
MSKETQKFEELYSNNQSYKPGQLHIWEKLTVVCGDVSFSIVLHPEADAGQPGIVI